MKYILNSAIISNAQGNVEICMQRTTPVLGGRKKAMKLFRKRNITIEDKVQGYVQLLRERSDDLVIPINRFYRDCRIRFEHGDDDGELVIFGLEQKGYEVRTVEVQKLFWTSVYIHISR